MVIAKKEQPADDTCGFACDVTNQQVEEMPGLAVMFNMQPVSRGRERAARSAVALRCITHQAPIQGGQPFMLLKPSTMTSSVQSGHVYGVRRHQVEPSGDPLFVFACGVASQLSWQNIMG